MSNTLKKNLKGMVIAVTIPFTAFLIVKLIAPELVSLTQVKSMLFQAILPAILAWGVMNELKAGMWDFSVGANVLVSAIVGGNIAKNLGLGVFGAIICCTIIGTLIGFLVGMVFIKTRIPSMIVSVGALLLLESISGLVYGGSGIYFGKEILVLSKYPYNLLYGAICAFIAYIVYSKRPFGFHVRLIGNGIEIAEQNGIDINRTRLKIFTVTGFFCGQYAVMELGNSGVSTSKSNMASMGIIFSAIICVYIAMSIEKYVNLVVGIYIGAVVASIIRLGILVTGGSDSFQQVFMAALLIIVFAVKAKAPVVISLFRKKRGKTTIGT